jgi:hypothetical protein
MDARRAWKAIHRARRVGNNLRRIRREFFAEPLKEVRRLLAKHVAKKPRAPNDFLVGHWRSEIRNYEEQLKRIDEGIARCEDTAAIAWPELRRSN